MPPDAIELENCRHREILAQIDDARASDHVDIQIWAGGLQGLILLAASIANGIVLTFCADIAVAALLLTLLLAPVFLHSVRTVAQDRTTARDERARAERDAEFQRHFTALNRLQ